MYYDINKKEDIPILLKQLRDSDIASQTIYKETPSVRNNINAKNNKILEEIFNIYGAISIKEFGNDTSHFAWLLIQHLGKKNLQLMELYLKEMKQNPKNFNKRNIAYLNDRVNVYKKIPQLYGTQGYKTKDKKYWKFRHIENISNIDKLRANMDLEPLIEYVKLLEHGETYKVILPKGYIYHEN